MQYLRRDPTGAWVPDDYVRYIESIRTRLSSSARDLASIDRLDFFSPKTLHDATLTNVAAGYEKLIEHRGLWLEICLTAPSQSANYKIRYLDVIEYHVEQINRYHYLLVHELRLSGEGQLVHEIEFTNGRHITVCARDLSFAETDNSIKKVDSV